MSRNDPMAHVRRMQDRALEARDMAAGRSRSDLDADRTLALAVWKSLDLVSVAAARVPDGLRARHPSVAWDETRGFRKRLTGDEYGRGDYDAAWSVLQNDIPTLIDALEDILTQEGCRDEGARPSGQDHPR